MNYVPNEKIQEWLDQGLTVRSAAVGRVGYVVEINQHGDVVIDSAKRSLGRCVTTFERGDEVSAIMMVGEVVINNADYRMH